MKYENGNIKIHIDCFSPALTLDCGQSFRWREKDGVWHGVVGERAYDLYEKDGEIVFLNMTPDEYESFARVYFDLDRDYAAILGGFSADEYLNTAVSEYYGIRVLCQEPWETLCSFIISQNNNIPRIKGIIERFCENFGNDLGNGDYSFPSAERTAELSLDDLAVLRAGFRSKYILDAAKKVTDGTVELSKLSSVSAEDAAAELMKIKGVGPKVAECTLLYGLGFANAFPKDVWVKRIMSELYPDGMPACAEGYMGIAQQYLFHWRRNLG